jgi:hypothetical protein
VPSTPADEYAGRLLRFRAAATHLARLDTRISRARLALFFAGVLLLVLGWRDMIGFGWPLIAAAVFGFLLYKHDRVIRARAAVTRTIAFYERGVARLEDRWTGTGEPGDRFRDDRHLYANDLDIFGRGSLFELLSIARTRAGEEILAAWLTHAASPDEILLRQQAVEEIAPALDMREALALAGTDVRATVDTDALVGWATGPRVLRYMWLRLVAVILTCLVIATAAYGLSTGRYTPLVTLLVVQAIFSIPYRARIQQVLHSADSPASDLDVVRHVLGRLEAERLTSPRLTGLRSNLESHGISASAAIGRLHRLVELHDWQHNQFFTPVAASFLWGTHLAWAIEQWRTTHGARVAEWLRTVGEFEALSSLATYRYEHPRDVWPELAPGRACFHARALGHPLLPSARTVPNDVSLAPEAPLLIVSGSNMSGKSTLLRTVGVNAVLALAGAPVRAAALRLTPVAIGATLRIQDSLQEGRSRFYAEITRIRELSDAAGGGLPLLFLLDELFHGTNSHDRLVGAAGVLRSLIDRGAIGLMTTHDLALTGIADALTPSAVNIHFEDHFEGNDIHFDYRIKPGAVTRSNAIALMRAVGLEVDPEQK